MPDGEVERALQRLEQRSFMRQRQVLRNEEHARAVNADLKEVDDVQHEVPAGQLVLACECGERSCHEPVHISADEYQGVREHPARFIVLPDHVFPEYERVVGRTDRFEVIEKLEYPLR